MTSVKLILRLLVFDCRFLAYLGTNNVFYSNILYSKVSIQSHWSVMNKHLRCLIYDGNPFFTLHFSHSPKSSLVPHMLSCVSMHFCIFLILATVLYSCGFLLYLSLDVLWPILPLPTPIIPKRLSSCLFFHRNTCIHNHTQNPFRIGFLHVCKEAKRVLWLDICCFGVGTRPVIILRAKCV